MAKQIVFLAFMVIDYEGVYQKSMKVFSSREKAQKHNEVWACNYSVSIGREFEIIEFEIDGDRLEAKQ